MRMAHHGTVLRSGGGEVRPCPPDRLGRQSSADGASRKQGFNEGSKYAELARRCLCLVHGLDSGAKCVIVHRPPDGTCRTSTGECGEIVLSDRVATLDRVLNGPSARVELILELPHRGPVTVPPWLPPTENREGNIDPRISQGGPLDNPLAHSQSQRSEAGGLLTAKQIHHVGRNRS